MTAKVALLVSAVWVFLASLTLPHVPDPYNWIIFFVILLRIWWDPIATFLDNEV
jgi:hypothetical protein